MCFMQYISSDRNRGIEQVINCQLTSSSTRFGGLIFHATTVEWLIRLAFNHYSVSSRSISHLIPSCRGPHYSFCGDKQKKFAAKLIISSHRLIGSFHFGRKIEAETASSVLNSYKVVAGGNLSRLHPQLQQHQARHSLNHPHCHNRHKQLPRLYRRVSNSLEQIRSEL